MTPTQNGSPLSSDSTLAPLLLYIVGGLTWPVLLLIAAVRIFGRVTGLRLRVRVVRERRR